MTRTDAFRAPHPEHRIVDVQYSDLVQDPIRTVDDLYAACGEQLDSDARDAIAAYVNAHPKGKFGAHGYDLAEFGLDPGELADRFAGYIDRYDVAVESNNLTNS